MDVVSLQRTSRGPERGTGRTPRSMRRLPGTDVWVANEPERFKRLAVTSSARRSRNLAPPTSLGFGRLDFYQLRVPGRAHDDGPARSRSGSSIHRTATAADHSAGT